MSNKILIFVLTKTGIIRWLANFLAAWMVAKGYVSDDAQTQVIGAVVAIVTGILSKAIEAIKTHETMRTQEVINDNTPMDIVVKQDGYAGPKTRDALRRALSTRK